MLTDTHASNDVRATTIAGVTSRSCAITTRGASFSTLGSSGSVSFRMPKTPGSGCTVRLTQASYRETDAGLTYDMGPWQGRNRAKRFHPAGHLKKKTVSLQA
jgi:hypothetical protein